VFLTGFVATILIRTVLRDFVQYQELKGDDVSGEVTGWKMVRGDVFRAPDYLPMFAICVGSGAQTLCMTAITLGFALLGFLSPANRGGFINAMLTLWVLASSVNGYTSARLYGAYDGVSSQRKLVTLGSAFLFPGISFSLFFMINVAIWSSGSSGAVPFSTLAMLLFMWFCVSIPLVVTGARIGYKRKQAEFPVRTNQIPRQIPPAPYNVPHWVYVMLAGLPPFGCVFLQTTVFLSSVTQNQIVYIFGLLSVVFASMFCFGVRFCPFPAFYCFPDNERLALSLCVQPGLFFEVLIVTCVEMSLVVTFLALRNENHKWAWTSFSTSAASSAYLFLYMMSLMIAQPGFGATTHVSTLLFTTYSLVISSSFALMCGSAGWFASFAFVRKIYSVIRSD
jgi:transmembrane 9 superfamily member 2/4